MNCLYVSCLVKLCVPVWSNVCYFRSQTCKYKEGGDWVKGCVEEDQMYILSKISTDWTLLSALRNVFT